MTWKQGTIADALPGAIESAKGAIESITGKLESLYSVLKTQAEFIKASKAALLDPIITLIKETCDEIIAELEKLKGGGLSILSISPHTYGVESKYDKRLKLLTLSTHDNMKYIASALDDVGDEYRPKGEVEYGAFIAVFSFPASKLMDYIDAIKNFASFFSLKEISDLMKKIDSVIKNRDDNIVVDVESTLPDFQELNTKDLFPELVDAIDEAQEFVYGVKKGFSSAGDVLDELINYLLLKVDQINQIIQKWKDLSDKFVNGIGGAGVYWKLIPVSSNGVDLIKETFSDQSSFPETWKEHDYSISITLVGGGPAIGLISTFLDQAV